MSDWRDSYDSWKLATPPEYEWGPGEEEKHEEDQARDRLDELLQEEATPEITKEIARLQEFIATEACPNCNVEWADQHLGECDICNGKRRVRKYDPAEISTTPTDPGDASQDMSGTDDEIAF